MSEDRELFKETMIGHQRTGPPQQDLPHVGRSTEAVKHIGRYPVIVRPAYTLGGTGGGIACNEDELAPDRGRGPETVQPHRPGADRAERHRLEGDRVRGDAGRSRQLHHHLQHGKHRPDGRPHRRLASSSPRSQTLSDQEYQMLRSASLKIIRALGIEGGCNVQFALDPNSFRNTGSSKSTRG